MKSYFHMGKLQHIVSLDTSFTCQVATPPIYCLTLLEVRNSGIIRRPTDVIRYRYNIRFYHLHARGTDEYDICNAQQNVFTYHEIEYLTTYDYTNICYFQSAR